MSTRDGVRTFMHLPNFACCPAGGVTQHNMTLELLPFFNDAWLALTIVFLFCFDGLLNPGDPLLSVGNLGLAGHSWRTCCFGVYVVLLVQPCGAGSLYAHAYCILAWSIDCQLENGQMPRLAAPGFELVHLGLWNFKLVAKCDKLFCEWLLRPFSASGCSCHFRVLRPS